MSKQERKTCQTVVFAISKENVGLKENDKLNKDIDMSERVFEKKMISLVIEAPGTVSKSVKNKRPEKIGIKVRI